MAYDVKLDRYQYSSPDKSRDEIRNVKYLNTFERTQMKSLTSPGCFPVSKTIFAAPSIALAASV